MFRFIFHIIDKKKKEKNEKAPEEENLGFRLARWHIDNWNRKFKEKKKEELENTLLCMLKKKKPTKIPFRAIFFMYENSNSLKKTQNGKLEIELLKTIDENKTWWIRKWAIKTIAKIWREKQNKLIPLLEEIIEKDNNKWVKCEAIDSISQYKLSGTENSLANALKYDEDINVKRSAIIALFIVNPTKVNHEDIIKVLELGKTKEKIAALGRFFSEIRQDGKHLVDGLEKVLLEKKQKLIILAMVSWILVNIENNLPDNIYIKIKNIINEANNYTSNRYEIVWFALSIMKLEGEKGVGLEIYEELKEKNAPRRDQKSEFEKIRNEWKSDKSSKRIKDNLIKLLNYGKELHYFDIKAQYLIDNLHQKAEILKDILALVNSADKNNNHAYLVIGLKEKDQEIISIYNVENYCVLEQQIAQLINEYINLKIEINLEVISTYDLFIWKQNGVLINNVPFTSNQKNPETSECIVVLQIIRQPKKVYELSKNFHGIHKKGQSWIRITSQSCELSQPDRERLMQT